MRIEYAEDGSKAEFQKEDGEFQVQRGSDLREMREKLWQKMTKTQQEEPIKEEEVAKQEDPAAPKKLPDRALVAKDLANFLRSQQQKTPNPLEQEAAQLRNMLEKMNKPKEELSFEQQVAYKLEAIERRLVEDKLEQERAKAQERYEKELNSYAERTSEYIRSRKNDYPGIVALGREEFVFNELFSLAEQGQELSEDDVASQLEKGLRADYEILKSIYEPSKAADSSETP